MHTFPIAVIILNCIFLKVQKFLQSNLYHVSLIMECKTIINRILKK